MNRFMVMAAVVVMLAAGGAARAADLKSKVLGNLQSEDMYIRDAAAKAVVSNPSLSTNVVSDIEAIAKQFILDDERKYMVKDAILLLGKLKSERSIPFLIEHLTFYLFATGQHPDGIETDYPCAAALIDIGEPAFPAVLARWLKDDDATVDKCVSAIILHSKNKKACRDFLTKNLEKLKTEKERNKVMPNLDALRSLWAARAAEKEAPIDWPARAATVKVGMTRAEVEKILPRWIPPGATGYPGGWSEIGQNTETTPYYVAEDWRVWAVFDVSKGGLFDGKYCWGVLAEPVRINKVMRSLEDKKEWMAKAAKIKPGMTRAEAERYLPAWRGISWYGANFESYDFHDTWIDRDSAHRTWSVMIEYEGARSERITGSRVVKSVKIETFEKPVPPRPTR